MQQKVFLGRYLGALMGIRMELCHESFMRVVIEQTNNLMASGCHPCLFFLKLLYEGIDQIIGPEGKNKERQI